MRMETAAKTRETAGKAKIYDRVKVSADATGTGKNMTGYISGIKTFLGVDVLEITYDEPDDFGRKGIAITNAAMLHHI